MLSAVAYSGKQGHSRLATNMLCHSKWGEGFFLVDEDLG